MSYVVDFIQSIRDFFCNCTKLVIKAYIEYRKKLSAKKLPPVKNNIEAKMSVHGSLAML